MWRHTLLHDGGSVDGPLSPSRSRSRRFSALPSVKESMFEPMAPIRIRAIKFIHGFWGNWGQGANESLRLLLMWKGRAMHSTRPPPLFRTVRNSRWTPVVLARVSRALEEGRREGCCPCPHLIGSNGMCPAFRARNVSGGQLLKTLIFYRRLSISLFRIDRGRRGRPGR